MATQDFAAPSANRLWPLPHRHWAMRMEWRDLLFAHWRVDTSSLRRLIPTDLELDLFEGRAYVGVVPFRMTGVQPRGLPALPALSAFPEINLRTYVRSQGKPGVWFFSLDAGQKLAVRVARRFFHLPYFDARFEIAVVDENVDYSVVRTHRSTPEASFVGRYRPVGVPYTSVAGSLESWLTDRYCLYSADGTGRVYRGEIDHDRWPLQHAECEVLVNTLGEWLEIGMAGPPHMVHFAKALEVHAWSVEPVQRRPHDR